MTHKDAPPETALQRQVREWHSAHLAQQGECVGWGRDKHGRFLAAYARAAEAAWQAAILIEREACVKVCESLRDPDIESNTSYADQVADGCIS